MIYHLKIPVASRIAKTSPIPGWFTRNEYREMIPKLAHKIAQVFQNCCCRWETDLDFTVGRSSVSMFDSWVLHPESGCGQNRRWDGWDISEIFEVSQDWLRLHPILFRYWYHSDWHPTQHCIIMQSIFFGNTCYKQCIYIIYLLLYLYIYIYTHVLYTIWFIYR